MPRAHARAVRTRSCRGVASRHQLQQPAPRLSLRTAQLRLHLRVRLRLQRRNQLRLAGGHPLHQLPQVQVQAGRLRRLHRASQHGGHAAQRRTATATWRRLAACHHPACVSAVVSTAGCPCRSTCACAWRAAGGARGLPPLRLLRLAQLPQAAQVAPALVHVDRAVLGRRHGHQHAAPGRVRGVLRELDDHGRAQHAAHHAKPPAKGVAHVAAPLHLHLLPLAHVRHAPGVHAVGVRALGHRPQPAQCDVGLLHPLLAHGQVARGEQRLAGTGAHALVPHSCVITAVRKVFRAVVHLAVAHLGLEGPPRSQLPVQRLPRCGAVTQAADQGPPPARAGQESDQARVSPQEQLFPLPGSIPQLLESI
mmetsp:Transcript_4079/g.10196  ORF Transcript_4079/g.10196 Transcript_4079/m.10196 type:complete len:365 (-) Transcript_4079:168-1262(-)